MRSLSGQGKARSYLLLNLQLISFQVRAWSDGCLITRTHSRGRCSWCKLHCVHFVHVMPLWGQQLHECSSCGHITQPCSRCPDFAKVEHDNGDTSALCARCSSEFPQWPDIPAPALRVRSVHCSNCLTLQVHQPDTSFAESWYKAVYVCSGCSR